MPYLQSCPSRSHYKSQKNSTKAYRNIEQQLAKKERWATPRRILLANIIHSCVFKYYLSSNLQSVVVAFSCNTFANSIPAGGDRTPPNTMRN